MFALTSGAEAPPRRLPRDPRPRFKDDLTWQFSYLRGCPDAQVPVGHLARRVLRAVALLDTSELESQYSALGRHGFHPRVMIQVLVYAMLTGLHHSTKISVALQTDAAFRLVSGGQSISSATIRRFRLRHRQFITDAFVVTVAEGWRVGMVDLKDIAIDSVRLRANASNAAVRTVARSKKRLADLQRIDVTTLSPEERTKHEQKVEKHREALRLCEERGRTSIVKTNEMAALIKFPSGAAHPGHRVTVAGAGLRTRFALGVLIDQDPCDFGKLPNAVMQLKEILAKAGIPPGLPLQIAVDAGYWSEVDLVFAEEERRRGNDILVKDPVEAMTRRGKIRKESTRFPRSLFVLQEDGTAICPAGRKMHGPYRQGSDSDRVKWRGDDCGSCELQSKCVGDNRRGQRDLTVSSLKGELAKIAMRKRMAEQGAKERYNRRIGTIEPIFSTVTDARGYRRVSSRHPEAIQSEIYLALLAHNLMCLDAAKERQASGDKRKPRLLNCVVEF